MADCSSCKERRAAANEPELTNEQKMFLLALESKDARYHKLIRWIVSAFVFCAIMMSAIFMYAWTRYDYVGVDVDGGQNGIANYIGDRGVIINGEDPGAPQD